MVKNEANVKKVIHLMFSQTKDFVFFAIFTTIIVALEILGAVIVRSFINSVIVGKLYEKISLYVTPFIIIVIVDSILMIFRSKAKSSICANVSLELSREAYKSILFADMQEIQKNKVRSCVNNIIPNCEYIAFDYIGKNVLGIIETVVMIIGLLITSLIVQPILGLIMLLITPFYIVIAKGFEILVAKVRNKYDNSVKENKDRINETYDNVKNIKLLNGIEYEKNFYDELLDDYNKATNNKSIVELINERVLCLLFTGIILAICFGLGGILDQTGTTIDAGTIAFYVLIVPVQMIMVYKSLHYKLSKVNVEKEVAELDLITSLRSEVRSEPITNLDEIHSVKFKDVSFTNSQNKLVLDNISFEIKRGEKLGILSLDKDSKDAFFELITKIDRPREGSISINNCDLSKINSLYLRSLIAAVNNENKVFNDSIINNICYPYQFDEYKYNDALYRSGLKSIIPNLVEKEHTMLDNSEDSELNRRVVLANAFYKDSKIYVLNEAASKFDPMDENDLMNEVFKLKNKIVILETEKAYLLSRCDRILILEDGEAVEYGKYDELMADKTSRFYKAIKNVGTKTARIS